MKGNIDAAYPQAKEDPDRYGRVCIIFDFQTREVSYTSNMSGAVLSGVIFTAAMLAKDDAYGKSEANKDRIALQGVEAS